MPAIHSLEHLMAEISRNHSDKIVDISPMGCQTGYYLSVINHDNYNEILVLLEKVLEEVLEATEVPACNEVQCGWAASHSLEGAQELARNMLAKKIRVERSVYIVFSNSLGGGFGGDWLIHKISDFIHGIQDISTK